jgi:hypothetical protein
MSFRTTGLLAGEPNATKGTQGHEDQSAGDDHKKHRRDLGHISLRRRHPLANSPVSKHALALGSRKACAVRFVMSASGQSTT